MGSGFVAALCSFVAVTRRGGKEPWCSNSSFLFALPPPPTTEPPLRTMAPTRAPSSSVPFEPQGKMKKLREARGGQRTGEEKIKVKKD